MNSLRLLAGGGIIIAALAWGATSLGFSDYDISILFGVPFLLLLGVLVLFGSASERKK